MTYQPKHPQADWPPKDRWHTSGSRQGPRTRSDQALECYDGGIEQPSYRASKKSFEQGLVPPWPEPVQEPAATH